MSKSLLSATAYVKVGDNPHWHLTDGAGRTNCGLEHPKSAIGEWRHADGSPMSAPLCYRCQRLAATAGVRQDAETRAAEEWYAATHLNASLLESGPWLSVTRAAQLTGVPAATLRGALRDGRMPGVYLEGLGWLVRESAVRLRIGLHAGRGRPFASDADGKQGGREP